MNAPEASTPFVFSEAPPGAPASPSHRDLQRATDAARLAGFRVVSIPPTWDACETADAALWQVERQAAPTWAVWVGFVPEPERYEELHQAALQRGVFLVNTPAQHGTALEFDRAYPSLADLTPATVVLSHPDEWPRAEEMGYPLFVKGSVRSRKEQGWAACVARDRTELQAHVNLLFRLPYRSRGKVLARQLAPLRHVRKTALGFPIGREFRVFLYRDQITGMGYYWDGDDPLAQFKPSEEHAVRSLAQEAARRLDVPFLAVDIGQTNDGDWIVIEVGDAQCAGYGQTPLLAAWHNLYKAITNCPPPVTNPSAFPPDDCTP